MNEKYIMMEMDDSRMKYLAEILGNESCKKILNLLAEKELSETELAKELAMPLNTIEYNLKKLIVAGLIEQSKHWWSVKGKKIPTYKLSNKKIIISPKPATSKLKSIIPGVLLVGFASVLLRYYLIAQTNARNLFQKAADTSAESTGILAASGAGNAANNAVSSIINSGWIWFLAGSLFAIIIFIILNWRRL